jgi:hypothetical protein
VNAAEYLPAEIRGVGFGLLATVDGVGDLVSSVVVGALWLFSPDVARLYVIATAMLGAVVISLSETQPA